MTKKEIILSALAPSNGALHTPVQIQKLLFLLDKRASDFLGGPHFHFIPYHYGPFDKGIYDLLLQLAAKGHVEILGNPNLHLRKYRLTPAGQKKGDKILDSLDPKIAAYIRKLSVFVRSLSFAALVSSIYRAYPEMQENSLFR